MLLYLHNPTRTRKHSILLINKSFMVSYEVTIIVVDIHRKQLYNNKLINHLRNSFCSTKIIYKFKNIRVEGVFDTGVTSLWEAGDLLIVNINKSSVTTLSICYITHACKSRSLAILPSLNST